MLPVHNHSEYSALDGYSRPNEIADRIEELGLPGAFLTDHGTVAGLQTFTDHMTWRNPRKKEGKRDLFVGYGMEAYQSAGSRKKTRDADGKAFKKGQDAFHLILLAKTREGYSNLLRISDAAHRTGFYYDPRVDFELLDRYHEGLICTTACMGSLVNQTLLAGGNVSKLLGQYEKIFGDDFYIELNTYDTDEQRELNATLVDIAHDRNIPLLYANDAHYAWPDDYDVHEALLCAQYNEYLLAPKKRSNAEDPTYHHPPSLYIMPEEDVRAALANLPQWAVDQAIENSDLLMEQCKVELEKPGLYLPKFKVPKGYEDSAHMLQSLVIEGMKERYGREDGKVPTEVFDRLEYEFEAIVDAGLQDYFLIVQDYINYALNQGIMVGPGRGSVGGSLMAYCLGITSIDPIKHGLQFERFWNPGRADGLPDIDVDFEQSSRQFMIEYAKKKYGDDRVLPIGNHIFMRPKSAIDKAGAVLYSPPPYGAMESIKKIIDTTTDAGQQKPWDEMMEMVGDELRGDLGFDREGHPKTGPNWIEKYPDLFELAELLSGRISTYGVHASAVVISAVPLEDRLPARMASDDDKRKVLVTQAEMKQVEKAGFPKFDFLGLKNLDVIMLAAIYSGEFCDPDEFGPKFLKMREEREKGNLERIEPELREVLRKIVKFFRNDLQIDHLPDSYWRNFDEGHTLGLFQIEESRSPRRISKELKPRSIEDLGFIVALNRPGPLRGGVVDRFLARRNGEEDITYPHPILEETLEESYGDFLFQEQVIAYFRQLGYSLSDADHIRKILGKKLVQEMQEELPTYLDAAEQFMPKQTAEAIWALIEDFSKYSFNKAHSTGYGMITGWTNYPKWKWPLANLMASITIHPKRVAAWINEAKKLGIPVLPPDINVSQETITRDGDAVLWGLRDIKGIGADAAKWVVKNAPYDSPEDFYEKTVNDEFQPKKNGKPVKVVKANHRTALMNAGCFDNFGYRLAPCDKCAGAGKVPEMVPKKSGDGLKRVLSPCPECEALGLVRVEIPNEKTRAKLEEELLGIALTNPHTDLIEAFADEIAACDPISEAEQEEEATVKVPGLVKEVDKRTATWPTRPEHGTDWARVTIEWEGETVTFAAFPEQYKRFHHVLVPNTLGEFTLKTSKKGPQLRKAFKYAA